VPPAEADVCNDRYRFNLEIRQQRSWRQFALRANRVIQDLHSAFRRIKPAQLLHGWNAEPSSRRVRLDPPSSGSRIVLLDIEGGIRNVPRSFRRRRRRRRFIYERTSRGGGRIDSVVIGEIFVRRATPARVARPQAETKRRSLNLRHWPPAGHLPLDLTLTLHCNRRIPPITINSNHNPIPNHQY